MTYLQRATHLVRQVGSSETHSAWIDPERIVRVQRPGHDGYGAYSAYSPTVEIHTWWCGIRLPEGMCLIAPSYGPTPRIVCGSCLAVIEAEQ